MPSQYSILAPYFSRAESAFSDQPPEGRIGYLQDADGFLGSVNFVFFDHFICPPIFLSTTDIMTDKHKLSRLYSFCQEWSVLVKRFDPTRISVLKPPPMQSINMSFKANALTGINNWPISLATENRSIIIMLTAIL